MNACADAASGPFRELPGAPPEWPVAPLSTLSDLAAARGLVNARGQRIAFDCNVAVRGALDYEQTILDDGRVPTRPDSRHDLYNAWCWLRYPTLKAALNVAHCTDAGATDGGRRSPRRDALTHLDESGVIVVSASAELLCSVAAQRWVEAFVHRRTDWAATRILVCGHGLLEQMETPYRGLTGKALLIEGDEDAVEPIEQAVATGIREATLCQSTADLYPLPMLGIPGWWPANEAPDYYADTAYFRPRRTPLEAAWQAPRLPLRV